MKFLGQMLQLLLFNFKKKLPNCFHKICTILHSYQQWLRFRFLVFNIRLGIISIFLTVLISAYSNDQVLNLVFPMASSIDNVFTYFLTSTYPLNCLFVSFAHFVINLVFLSDFFENTLYILDMNFSKNMWFLQNFLPFVLEYEFFAKYGACKYFLLVCSLYFHHLGLFSTKVFFNKVKAIAFILLWVVL